ncbi:MAG: galactose oxidase early set domain-containing protein [Pseudomonadota bacterium]
MKNKSRLLPIAHRFSSLFSMLVGFNVLVTPLAVFAHSPQALKSIVNGRSVFKACQPAMVEAQLLQREKALLGSAHAAEHAHMRTHRCEVERGIRKELFTSVVKPAAVTLAEDNAVKQDALKKISNTSTVSTFSTSTNTTTAAATSSMLVTAAAVAPDLTTQGRWSSPFIIPVVGVTAVLLHTGNVMFWSYDPVDYHNPANSNNGVGYIWNPTTRTGRNIPPPENIWCGGQTILGDGRVYIAGGNLRYPDANAPTGLDGWEGTLTNYTFNPITETWARQPDMRRGRWYPTVTQLADNRAVITSGIDETGTSALNNDVEVFTPNANIDGIGLMKVVSLHNSSGVYPLQFLLPSGKMLEAGPSADSSFQLDTTLWNWSSLPRLKNDHYNLGNGISYTDATVTPAKQLIMVAGGYSETAGKAVAGNEWLDGNNPTAGWRAYPNWIAPRHNSNTVLLPDGTMLTVGGNSGLYGYDNPLLQAELYSKPAGDTTGVWKTVAPHSIQAAYHSTAILLPDATVLLSQDDMDSSAAAAFEHKVQVYSPPYLFKGAQPTITSVPTTLKYNQSFKIATNRNVTKAVLIAPGATTHGNDMHQRLIKLKVQAGTNSLTANVPNSSALVPPGYYMLFVIDSVGIPSVAKFVHVG